MTKIIIALLTLATAAIHFNYFISGDGVIFALNALGYVMLLALLYLPIPAVANLRRPVRFIFMGYTALTIAAYVGYGVVTGDWTVPLGPITKLIEIALIGLLWLEGQSSKA